MTVVHFIDHGCFEVLVFWQRAHFQLIQFADQLIVLRLVETQFSLQLLVLFLECLQLLTFNKRLFSDSLYFFFHVEIHFKCPVQMISLYVLDFQFELVTFAFDLI